MGSLVFRIAGSGGGGGTCADGSWVTGKVGSYALEFDGSNDYGHDGLRKFHSEQCTPT